MEHAREPLIEAQLPFFDEQDEDRQALTQFVVLVAPAVHQLYLSGIPTCRRVASARSFLSR
jgi:hypothetical protein